jgi:hypothetical protein
MVKATLVGLGLGTVRQGWKFLTIQNVPCAKKVYDTIHRYQNLCLLGPSR